MVDLPTGRRGQFMAAGLLFILAFLVTRVGILPLLEAYGWQSERLLSEELQEKSVARLVRRIPTLERQLASLSVEEAATNSVPDAQVGAHIQECFLSLATTAGVVVRSVDTLPPEQRERRRLIGIRVDLSSDMPSLIELLRTLGTDHPELVPDDLVVTSSEPSAAAADPKLDVSIGVYQVVVDAH